MSGDVELLLSGDWDLSPGRLVRRLLSRGLVVFYCQTGKEDGQSSEGFDLSKVQVSKESGENDCIV